MTERGIDALLVTGPGRHNPAMMYLTGGAHLTRADLIKKRGQPPVLFHWPMERDEAAKTGLPTRDLNAYRPLELLMAAGGDAVKAEAMRYARMLRDCEVQGTVALYGRVELGYAYSLFNRLADDLPEITFIGEADRPVVTLAAATKDADEVERIRRVGKATVETVEQVMDFLSGHRAKESYLVKGDGSPLTVGEVRGRIDGWLLERGAANPEGAILAVGRDAGVPHSVGNDSDPIALGRTIVLDIFPQEVGGGYFFDFTRTWCLGFAPDPVQSAYQDVLDVFRSVRAALRADELCRQYQEQACALFEARGHPTLRSHSQTDCGYVHSLGHGVGLGLHELPRFSLVEGNPDRLLAGSVVTLEPGLYYPDDGYGVRLEDTLWVRPDGAVETLAPFPMDLVIKTR